MRGEKQRLREGMRKKIIDEEKMREVILISAEKSVGSDSETPAAELKGLIVRKWSEVVQPQ